MVPHERSSSTWPRWPAPGLKYGAQLEQALRMEVCGADRPCRSAIRPSTRGSLRSSSPSFAQFVDADFDERERLGIRGSEASA